MDGLYIHKLITPKFLSIALTSPELHTHISNCLLDSSTYTSNWLWQPWECSTHTINGNRVTDVPGLASHDAESTHLWASPNL